LLKRLTSLNAAGVLPPTVRTRFEQHLADNQCRVEHIASGFGSLNRGFDSAGVNYAVIKGFSLVPEFCPDASLRVQSDLDYLINKQSLQPAQRVLGEAGYFLTRYSTREFVFSKPQKRTPSRFDNPYVADTDALVELHLTLWDSEEHSFQLPKPQFTLDHTSIHRWRGLSFPILQEQDVLLLQLLHIFGHVLTSWVKMSWLLELINFLNQRWSDTLFWEKVDQRVQETPDFAEFVALVMGLTIKVFEAPISPVAERWTTRLRPAAKLWLDYYGRSWTFENHAYHENSLFPQAKLSLLLHQEYIADAETRKRALRRRLFPWKWPSRIGVSDKQESGRQLYENWRTRGFVLHMLAFHFGAGLRYFWELPRWRELNRNASR
jgi:hypothetical protein